ncbi:MAG TPA: response regulator, partial [Syntrophales bacterium]|nr:response regulator [Syntrophales bacterium]
MNTEGSIQQAGDNGREVADLPEDDVPHVLVVDDSPDIVELLTDTLSQHGYRVSSAVNGPEALLSVQSAPPDLVLLDVGLKDMDGFEVCRRLKSDDRNTTLPIVFISGLGDALDIIKGFRAGGIDYIAKPF